MEEPLNSRRLESKAGRFSIPASTRTNKLNSTTVSEGGSGVTVSVPGRRTSSKSGGRKTAGVPNLRTGGYTIIGAMPRSATRSKGSQPEQMLQHRMHFVMQRKPDDLRGK